MTRWYTLGTLLITSGCASAQDAPSPREGGADAAPVVLAGDGGADASAPNRRPEAPEAGAPGPEAGAPEVAYPPESCRSDCDEWTGECPRPAAGDLEATRASWGDSERCGLSGATDIEAAYAGQCADGTVFLVRAGFGFEARFFEPGGEFIALLGVNDDLDADCPAYYWPAPFACPGGVITEIFCDAAGHFTVGQSRPFPYQELRQ